MSEEIFKSIISQIYFLAKSQLNVHWPFVVLFSVFIISGIILQIMLLRSGGNSKLPAWFNQLVGSITYTIIFLIITAVCYWIFGVQVVDEKWLALFGALSFPATGFFLSAIGFWYY